jgi:hypothetical protein
MTTVTADIVPSVRGGPVSLDGYAAGERVFDGVAGLTFDIDRIRPTEHVVHVTLRPSAR